jgi:hypothetical protein
MSTCGRREAGDHPTQGRRLQPLVHRGADDPGSASSALARYDQNGAEASGLSPL